MNSKIEIPTMEAITEELVPILKAIEDLKSQLKQSEIKNKYYRNSDLKKIFGLSDNTIIKYRDKNSIPYTYIESIYYYPVNEFNELLQKNSNFGMFKNKPS